MHKLLSTICLIMGLITLGTVSLSGQSQFGYGFRAGLSFSTFSGDLETDQSGNELESYGLATGFHIGVNVAYKFTDLVGLRGELNFSQRGTKYTYEGDSYYILGLHEAESVLIRGNRDMTLNVTNAYVDVPITLYYKVGPIELSGGVGAGLSIGSTGGGNIVFEGVSPTSGQDLMPFEIDLNYNYRSDGARQVEASTTEVRVDGRIFNIPDRVGAYYWFEEKDKDLMKGIDVFLVGGLSFYLNEGFYLGGRVFYGLTDVDRNEYDISLANVSSNGDYNYREDTNRNITYQVSLGFSF